MTIGRPPGWPNIVELTMADALTETMSEASRKHAESCARLQEACRDSIFTDKAISLAMRIAPAEKWDYTRLQLEQTFREIHRMTKDGTLG